MLMYDDDRRRRALNHEGYIVNRRQTNSLIPLGVGLVFMIAGAVLAIQLDKYTQSNREILDQIKTDIAKGSQQQSAQESEQRSRNDAAKQEAARVANALAVVNRELANIKQTATADKTALEKAQADAQKAMLDRFAKELRDRESKHAKELALVNDLKSQLQKLKSDLEASRDTSHREKIEEAIRRIADELKPLQAIPMDASGDNADNDKDKGSLDQMLKLALATLTTLAPELLPIAGALLGDLLELALGTDSSIKEAVQKAIEVISAKGGNAALPDIVKEVSTKLVANKDVHDVVLNHLKKTLDGSLQHASNAAAKQINEVKQSIDRLIGVE